VGLFQWFSEKHKLSEVRTELDALKRSFAQIQQEWDATVDRVTKTLRRIRRAEQAADAAVQDAAVQDGADGEAKLPLTTIAASGDRKARILKQLAEKGR